MNFYLQKTTQSACANKYQQIRTHEGRGVYPRDVYFTLCGHWLPIDEIGTDDGRAETTQEIQTAKSLQGRYAG